MSMPGGHVTLSLWHSDRVTTGCHPVTLLSPSYSTLPLNHFAPKKRLEARNIKARGAILAPRAGGGDRFTAGARGRSLPSDPARCRAAALPAGPCGSRFHFRSSTDESWRPGRGRPSGVRAGERRRFRFWSAPGPEQTTRLGLILRILRRPDLRR